MRVCDHCRSRPRARGRVLCAPCGEDNRVRSLERRNKRRRGGWCVEHGCGERAAPSRGGRCDGCADRAADQRRALRRRTGR